MGADGVRHEKAAVYPSKPATAAQALRKMELSLFIFIVLFILFCGQVCIDQLPYLIDRLLRGRHRDAPVRIKSAGFCG